MKPIVETIVKQPQDQWPFRHPSIPEGQVWNFYGSDGEQLFEKNKTELPPNWMYHNIPVVYNFNKQGLRMKKEVQDVNGDYIYFGGSSFTLGCGLNEEDRFTEKVSSVLGLDFINHAGPIYGIKLNTMAFFNFLRTGHHLPKIVVMEHFQDSYNFNSNGNYLLYKSKFKASQDQFPQHYTAHAELMKTDFLIEEATLYTNILKSACQRLGIKFVEISFYKDEPAVIVNNIPSVDRLTNSNDLSYCFSRDVWNNGDGTYTGHAGVGINQDMTDLLLKLL